MNSTQINVLFPTCSYTKWDRRLSYNVHQLNTSISGCGPPPGTDGGALFFYRQPLTFFLRLSSTNVLYTLSSRQLVTKQLDIQNVALVPIMSEPLSLCEAVSVCAVISTTTELPTTTESVSERETTTSESSTSAVTEVTSTDALLSTTTDETNTVAQVPSLLELNLSNRTRNNIRLNQVLMLVRV